ncbi:MAG: PAS domain-containing protein [Anaerolineales bacterium]|nr:PAS domain-containing protein [Anaerolineales bacterium]
MANLEFNVAVYALFVAGTLTLSLAIFSWRRRRLGLWALPFTALALAATIWSFGYGLEIAVPTLEQKIFWGQWQYLGITSVPASWFLFAMSYTGRNSWLQRNRVLALLALPALTFFFALMHNQFHLIWRTTAIADPGQLATLKVTYGPWFWVYWIYAYILMFTSTTFLLMAFFRYDRAYRWQNASLLVGALMPLAGNFFFVTGLNPVPGLDWSPFALGMSALLIAAAIFRTRLFDLVPVARRFAVENLTDALIAIDTAGRVVDVNPTARDLLAASQSSFIGQRLAEVSPVGAQLAHLISQGPASQIQASFNNYDYDLRLSPLLNHRHIKQGQLISLRDITQLKRTEQLLASRNRVLETLNKFSAELSADLALKPVLETTLRTATQLLDMTSAYISEWDEELGTLTVVAEYYGPKASAPERVSNLGFSYRMEEDFGRSALWLQMPNQNYVVHVDEAGINPREKSHLARYGGQTVFKVPLQVKGRPIGTLELWESRHKREFSRDESTLILSIAGQVALAMENALLYERAVAANQVKSRILTQVNHELRTPLSVILLFSSMLESDVYGKLNDKQAAANSKVLKNAQYLRTLVTQLLAQAELSSKKVALNNEPFRPVDLFDQIQAQMKPLADEKGLSLVMGYSAEMPAMLLGDPLRLQQIVINLVSNAIKYSDSGSITIEIGRARQDSWLFSVRDQGRGIAETDLENIFEPFWQAEDSARTSAFGVGLGLSIVQQFVELMNGKIEVTSELGQGSVFTVTLPLLLPAVASAGGAAGSQD